MKEDLSYDFFVKVDDDTNLGKLFNFAFRYCRMPLMSCAPRTFSSYGNDWEECAGVFFQLRLAEMYLHSIIENICRWKADAEIYNTEFGGSWKYYASSKRIDSIRECGGDDDDYNADGSIKTKVSKRVLRYYTIVEVLSDRDWCNIFTDTYPSDMCFFCRLIVSAQNLSINDIFRKMGKQPITMYKKEGNNMVACDWTDEAMMKAERQSSSEEFVDVLFGVFVAVRNLVDEMLALKPMEDNKDFFLALPGRIQNILDCKIEAVPLPGKEVDHGTL